MKTYISLNTLFLIILLYIGNFFFNSTFWCVVFSHFLQCVPRAFNLMCAHTVYYFVSCIVLSGMVTKHTLTPPDCFSWVALKQYISTEANQTPFFSSSSTSSIFFTHSLCCIVVSHHLSNCKAVVPVFLCLVFASSITTWWWLWKPIWSVSRHWLKSLLVLFIFSFSFITALFFCSPTTFLFVTCLARMQTGRYRLWMPSAVLCHSIRMCLKHVHTMYMSTILLLQSSC